MAKHKSTKSRFKRCAITNRPKPVVDEKIRQEKILPAIASLKSPNVQDRAVSLGALATLIEDQNMRHMLLKERLIKVILSNILSDSSLEIVAQGFGVLRNIVLAEGHDSALFLLRENIKVPINSEAKKAMQNFSAVREGNTADSTVLSNLVENILGLVSAIIMTVGQAERFESAIELGVTLVLSYADSFSKKVLNSALEMLYYKSEDLDLLEETFSPDRISKIRHVADNSKQSSSKIYGLGIEFNLQMSSGSNLIAATRGLISFLSEVDVNEVDSVQLCLELLAVAAQSNETQQVMLIVNECGATLINLLSKEEFKLRAVSVLNNIGWALNALNHSWETDSNQIFESVVSNCFLDFQDSELVSSSLGLISATLVQNPDLVLSPGFSSIVDEIFKQIEVLYGAQDQVWIDMARSLVVLLGSGKSAEKLNKIAPAGQLILLLLEHGDAEAQIDALNSLFDIYGDNDAPFNDEEYESKQINQRLEAFKPSLKRSLKSTPKSDELLRESALGALANLDKFIVYKKRN